MCESFAPAISVLGLSQVDVLIFVHTDLCTAVLTGADNVIVKNWKQAPCPSGGE